MPWRRSKRRRRQLPSCLDQLFQLVAELFIAQRVRRDVDYVSIDLDTIDIWVFIALVRAGFRPKVLSIEYNSNFPVGFAFAFPDAEHAVPSQRFRKWDKGCYMGSSASAVEMAAKELGYIIVDVEPGLDLFLVDAHLWSDRPRPVLTTDAIYRPFNIRSGHSALRAGAYSTLPPGARAMAPSRMHAQPPRRSCPR